MVRFVIFRNSSNSLCCSILVTRQDVGDGWWEGVNSRGEKGLFPAEYVSPQSNDNQPPPPPSAAAVSSAASTWSNDHNRQPPIATSSPPNAAGLLSFVTASNAAAAPGSAIVSPQYEQND